MHSTRLRRTSALLPFVLLLTAFALRAIDLSAQSLWYDEGYSVMLAQQAPAQIIAQVAVLDLNTPLHYLLLHGWINLAGSSEFAVRFLSVFAGVVTVALAYPLARLIAPGSVAAGHWAMLLMALWPVGVAMSREARMYALLLCLGVLSVVQLLRCLRAPHTASWWAWAAWNVAAFGTHILGAFLFAAQATVLVVWWLTHRYSRPRMAVPALLISGAIILVWGAGIAAQMSAYGTTYATRLRYAPLLWESLAGNVLPRLQPDTLTIPAAVLVGSIIMLSALAGKRLGALAMITALSIAGVAALGALTGKFLPRYAAMTSPLVVTAFGVFISQWAGSPMRLRQGVAFAAGVALAVLCLVGDTLLYTDVRYANDDFRGASAYLRQHLASDETILLVSGHFAPVFQYYYGEQGWHPVPDAPMLDVRNALDYASAAPALNRALAHRRGAWLLLWQDAEIDPSGIVQALLRRVAHLLQPEVTLTQFHGLRLLHYRFDAPYEPMPETIPATDSQIETSGNPRGLGALGCQQFRPAHAGDVLMEVACFWTLQPGSNLPYDTQVSLRLIDAQGMRVAQSDQMLAQPVGLPTLSFEKPITSFYFVPLPDQLPAGDYTLRAIPYIPDGEIAPQVITPISLLSR